MDWNRRSVKQRLLGLVAPRPERELDPSVLKGMARGIMTTRPDEIGCGECFEQLGQFVDLALAGRDASGALPLIQDHLDRCPDCLEELDALLAALDAVA